MNEDMMLKVLNRIQMFIDKEELSYAKDYIRLEINNLTGLTPKLCKGSLYYPTYDWFCKSCSNRNCSDNQNINL